MAPQRGNGCVGPIFVWSLSWAVFAFRFCKEHFWQMHLLDSSPWMLATLVSADLHRGGRAVP